MARLRLQTVQRQRGPVANPAKYDRPVKVKADEPVPVTGDLVACPECGGGVIVKTANYSDEYFGIVAWHTWIYAKHRPGGKRVGQHTRCAASETKVRGNGWKGLD